MAKKQAIIDQKSDQIVKEEAQGFNFAQFTNETKQELGKVVWPSRPQLISESIAVMLMVVLIATLIYFVDKLFGWAAGKVF